MRFVLLNVVPSIDNRVLQEARGLRDAATASEKLQGEVVIQQAARLAEAAARHSALVAKHNDAVHDRTAALAERAKLQTELQRHSADRCAPRQASCRSVYRASSVC